MTENFYNVLDVEDKSNTESDSELIEKNDNNNIFLRKKKFLIRTTTTLFCRRFQKCSKKIL